MPATAAELASRIAGPELDFEHFAATLTRAELAPLLELVEHPGNPLVARRATHLAALVGGVDAAAVLEVAAASSQALLRTAAACALGSYRHARAATLLAPLISDPDAGVVFTAVRSAGKIGGGDLRPQVEWVRDSHPRPHVRLEAQRMLASWPLAWFKLFWWLVLAILERFFARKPLRPTKPLFVSRLALWDIKADGPKG